MLNAVTMETVGIKWTPFYNAFSLFLFTTHNISDTPMYSRFTTALRIHEEQQQR